MRLTIYVLTIVLGLTNLMQSQEVSLQLDIKTDTPTSTVLRFDSFDEAETKLKFKIDSLKREGYPFLTQKNLIKDKKLLVHVDLNQKIDSIYMRVEERYSHLLPKSLTQRDNEIRISYTEIDDLLGAIVLNMKAEGSSFGKTSLSNIQILDKNLIEADLIINTGQKRTIDKINIKGYPLLSKTFLARYSNLKIGKLFIETEIQNKTEQLNNIPFVEVKKPTEVLFKKDSTELFIYLEKVKSNSFDGFLGFGNTEEDGFQLNGYLNMVLLNNLDFGERLGVIYKNDGIGQQTFEGNIKLPFVFKSPISVEAGLRLFRRDSSFSNSSQDLNLSYQLNEKFKVQGGIEFINSTSLEPEDFNSSSNVVSFNSTFYSIGFNFLKLNPRQDFNEDTFLNLKGSVGERQSILNSDQYKLSLTGQHQILLNYRNRIYINLNSQILISDSFINNELFRFGGVNSIRGFSENSLIANRFAVLQTEYRYLLDTNLFANTVLDLGNYENKLDQFSENILGYGIGLGLKSKSGIFKLVLANAVSTGQKATFSNSKIHISFASFF
jgi:hypothetical protein